MTLVVHQRTDRSNSINHSSIPITALLLHTDAARQASARTRTPNQPPRFLLTTLSLVLNATIFDRQKAYTMTLAESIALLEGITLQRRLEVRLGEKEILSVAALIFDETIAETGRKSREDEVRITSRNSF